jgi:hypothetical protein
MSTKYAVFARRASEEALTRIGTVEVAAGASVEDAACAKHGKDWIELVAIPETEMTWAIKEDAR